MNETRLSGSVVDRLYWLIADEGAASANVKGVGLATMGELYVCRGRSVPSLAEADASCLPHHHHPFETTFRTIQAILNSDSEEKCSGPPEKQSDAGF